MRLVGVGNRNSGRAINIDGRSSENRAVEKIALSIHALPMGYDQGAFFFRQWQWSDWCAERRLDVREMEMNFTQDKNPQFVSTMRGRIQENNAATARAACLF
ncbi:hypothetical protein [Agrobacterium vaccinii]|uniref:hypothetical protein n=1 Tax=Agrobacterium vaccinii TaxID=2735528 RepID=UPI001E45BFE6|nr:hypothetical protein [Agrobacterium vaccinii]UHS56874.1 hypothetical protein HRS00_08705 [Agrobacterium vaccinii]